MKIKAKENIRIVFETQNKLYSSIFLYDLIPHILISFIYEKKNPKNKETKFENKKIKKPNK